MMLLGTFRYLFATVFMVGSAPQYFALWLGWRGLSVFLPTWIYQKVDDMGWSLYQRLVLFFFEHSTGVQLYFYGDIDEVFKKKERVLYIGNHQSTVDWILCNMVALRQGSLGHLRYIMKNTLQWLPLYGFCFYHHGCIYVKRRQFKADLLMFGLEYLQNPNFFTWLVVFPEGSRYNPDTPGAIEKSQSIAEEHGLPPLQNHLTPRSKGTFLTLQKLRDYFDAVYDVTVVYGSSMVKNGKRKRAPQLTDFLSGKCSDIYIHVKRIPLEEVPTTELELKTWLHSVFKEKDRVVADFYTSDSEVRSALVKKGRRHKLSLLSTFPSFLFFSATFIVIFFSDVGRSLYLKAAVYGTLLGYAWFSIKSVC